MNPLKDLPKYGQAVWLDFLARDFITRGDLKILVDEDGLRGVTSNPAIFEKALGGSDEYDDSIKRMLVTGDRPVADLYQCLAVEDIKSAADVLRTVYDSTGGSDGFVSLEVSPYLANDTKGSVTEAKLLWTRVSRENVMIKVPATQAGLPAIRELIAEGINVNITLLFSQEVYKLVVETYLSGLEALASERKDLSSVASVASFFVSRIDSAVDRLLDEKTTAAGAREMTILRKLKGKVAIANAKLAYQHYKTVFTSDRWKKLDACGAKPQRLLWASTGTKNNAYSDVLYVEELVGPNTVNTMPPATLEAFRDHGKVRNSLEHGVEEAQQVLDRLADTGISLDSVTDTLIQEGVQLFSDAADNLLGAMANKRKKLLESVIDSQKITLGTDLDKHFKRATEEWRAGGDIRRLWQRDKSLWTSADEDKWLGWLDSVRDSLSHLGAYQAFGEEVKREGFTSAVLLGMGGSSLGPEVLAGTIGTKSDGFALHILDSSDPEQIRRIEASLDIRKTLFIVSSKSGSTIETNALLAYFFSRVIKTVGQHKAGRHFIAITDKGSSLEKTAQRDGFRHVFLGEPMIGGRYSVLSAFGLVPAALTEIDLAQFLKYAQIMVHSCGPDVPPAENPGVQLGIAMGLAGSHGRDKVTILSSSELFGFAAWAEQLIAESTGKNGKGLIPVVGESLGAPDTYGPDRLFVDLRTQGRTDAKHDAKLSALGAAGHPIVQIILKSAEHIGQEFFRFEVATAVAGAVLGLNPFDQPDVEASKGRARQLTVATENQRLPAETPVATSKLIDIFTDTRNADYLRKAGANETIDSWLKAHFGRIRLGDYAALLAYVARDDVYYRALQAIRIALRDRWRVATTVGFGPRFLHSTGQAHKGGPNSGVFLQITADANPDLVIPGYGTSFGRIKATQARGDFEVLAERGRRALRVHLKGDTVAALTTLEQAVTRALE